MPLRFALIALGLVGGLGYLEAARATSCSPPHYVWELELESVTPGPGGNAQSADLATELARLGPTAELSGDFVDDESPTDSALLVLDAPAHADQPGWALGFEKAVR